MVKGEDGEGAFEAIDREGDVIKLAARAGALHLAEEFGISDERTLAFGRETQLAIGAGIDALRDAGIPLVLRYRTTTTGSRLPDRWVLPEALRDDTGIVFASAFPGMDDFAGELNRYWADRGRHEQLEVLRAVQERLTGEDGAGTGLAEVKRRIHELELEVIEQPYKFDRRFLFRVLAMGHSQLAELICARGPNTQINAACASTTQAVALAQDWIRAGRARRVIVVAADDVTSEQLLPWIGSGFLASGAAATDGVVEEAALPFDRRRHGMLLGMGAAALVVESAASARERAITPICEVLGASTANSAFHGTRLDVEHIGQVMEDVVSQAERRGVRREEIAPETMFVSHETYTPARGGSAAAEIHALRQVFGDHADRIVIANTKGFTGHPMGVGIEDVVAVKALETGIVPPVPNFRDVDPELGELNLSRGGVYPVRYALRLAAGFGSQISMTLLRWTPVADGRHRSPEELGFAYRIADRDAWADWMRRVSGQDDPQLEVVTRTLRVIDAQTAARTQTPQANPYAQRAQAEPPAQRLRNPPRHARPPRHRKRRRHTTAPGTPSHPGTRGRPGSASHPHAHRGARARRAGARRRPRVRRRGHPARIGTRGRADRVPDRPARPRPRSRSRPRDRHRQTSRSVRRDPRGLLNRTRRHAQTARLPHTPQRRRVRTRPHTPGHPSHHTHTPTHPHAHRGAASPSRRRSPPPPPGPTPRSPSAYWNSWPRRPGTRPTCSTPTSISKPTSGSTPSNKPKCSPRSARPTQSNATTRSNCATTPHSAASSGSCSTTHPRPPQPPHPHPSHPTPTAAPEPAAPEPAAAPGSDAEVTQRVLELVAAQTGYPTDLLDPDLDLEADLGIDTVKQAEVFAAIREAYSIERDDTLKLRDYPTLRSVVGFVLDHTPQATPATTPAPQASRTPTAAPEPAAPSPPPPPGPPRRRLPAPGPRPRHASALRLLRRHGSRARAGRAGACSCPIVEGSPPHSRPGWRTAASRS